MSKPETSPKGPGIKKIRADLAKLREKQEGENPTFPSIPNDQAQPTLTHGAKEGAHVTKNNQTLRAMLLNALNNNS